jgi:hypothetical protein
LDLLVSLLASFGGQIKRGLHIDPKVPEELSQARLRAFDNKVREGTAVMRRGNSS